MEQVGPGPVKHRHEVIANDLHTEFGQIPDALLVIFNVHIPGGQTDLDVIMDIDGLHHIHIKSVLIQLLLDLGNLRFLPDFSGQLVVQRPDNGGHTGNLLDIR